MKENFLKNGNLFYNFNLKINKIVKILIAAKIFQHILFKSSYVRKAGYYLNQKNCENSLTLKFFYKTCSKFEFQTFETEKNG